MLRFLRPPVLLLSLLALLWSTTASQACGRRAKYCGPSYPSWPVPYCVPYYYPSCGPAWYAPATQTQSQTQTRVQNYPPTNLPAAAWMQKPVSQWPQIVLTNYAEFDGHAPFGKPGDSFASSFLIQTSTGEVFLVTSAHLITDERNCNPPIPVGQLDGMLKAWYAYPRGDYDTRIAARGLASPALDNSYLDWLVLKIDLPRDRIPFQPLSIRKTPVQPGERIYFVATPYRGPGSDRSQNVYPGRVGQRSNDGYTFSFVLDDSVNRRGFSGAPIIDANGYLVGSHGMGDYAEAFAPAYPLLEKGGEPSIRPRDDKDKGKEPSIRDDKDKGKEPSIRDDKKDKGKEPSIRDDKKDAVPPRDESRSEASATLIVSLPADARLFVGSYLTRSTSAQRTFISPPLQPGKQYHYTLTAEVQRDGQVHSLRKQVPVAAGREVRIDFDFDQPVRATRLP
jgi:uncharacterized protein (TIGR03000 family)